MTSLANALPASVQAFAEGSFVTSADRNALISYYTGSWLLVHFMANQMPKALLAYPALVQMRGEKGAWQAIFGGPEKYQQLDSTLDKYRHSGGYVTISNPFEPVDIKGRELPMTKADAFARYALLANVQRRAGANKEASASHARALELSGKNPAVSYGQTRKSMH